MKNVNIKYNKKYLLYFVLIIEIIAYAYFYVAGSQGVRLLQEKRLYNFFLQEQLEQQRRDNNALSDEIALWQQSDFLKEKVAREDLQMAFPGDTVYYLVS